MRRRLKNENLITFLGDVINYYNQLINKLGKKGYHSHVLMFHDITESVTEAQINKAAEDDYSVTVDHFREIIGWLKEKNYQFVSIDSLSEGTVGAGKSVITFDDGLESVYTLAWPILREMKIPFCVYVITGKTGTEGYLSKEQLIDLSKDPLCTIGSHTVNHVMTRFQTDRSLENELSDSRHFLEELTGKPVWHFAYPYGSFFAHSRSDEPYVIKAGYRTATITYQDYIDCIANSWRIPRFDASRVDLLKVL